MVSVDITVDFRSSVQDVLKTLPDNRRRPRPRTRKPSDGQGEQGYAEAYLKEAYAILEHINTLNTMLASIRHAYLAVDSFSSTRHSAREKAFDAKQTDRWEGVKRLTNQERDEIDLQAKVILKRCMERVKQLELLEQKRASTSPTKAPLLRLLPARLLATPSTSDSDILAAHYAGITWYLNRRLMESSNTQREMQEERVRRQLERAKSLGSTVGGAAAGLGGAVQEKGSEMGVRRFDPSLATNGRARPATEEEDDAPLSSAQMQLFELENAAILRSAENVLAQVQRAEASLTEIGQLQSELVHHLTVQTEMTDRLYEEAIATQGEVERGNQQLRKAKERGGDARKWLLIFLLGASLALLFLHYYS